MGEDRHAQTHAVPIDRVARIFYAPVSAFAVAELPSGWRGAIVRGDRIEGTVSDLSPDGVTVTSILFGSQVWTPQNGLLMVNLADVNQTEDATVVRHAGGQTIANVIFIRAGKVVVQDSILGILTLSSDDLRSIEQPRGGGSVQGK